MLTPGLDPNTLHATPILNLIRQGPLCGLRLKVSCPPLLLLLPRPGFQQLAGSLLSTGQLLPYQESVVVDMLHKEVQRSMENQWQMARLETKRCVCVCMYRVVHKRHKRRGGEAGGGNGVVVSGC